MEIVPLTPDRYDDLAELFDTTVVTRSCYYTRPTDKRVLMRREV
jgi:hypothetical protein